MALHNPACTNGPLVATAIDLQIKHNKQDVVIVNIKKGT
jgi:hypothetical protein